LQFEPIRLEGMADYTAKLAQTPKITSDYSFVNLWGWAPEYGLEWAPAHGLIWLRQQLPEPAYWAPVGPWDAVDWAAIWPELAPGSVFTRVPEALAAIWRAEFGAHMEIEARRRDWDYIYRVDELVALKGNRFHKKKNLLNQFIKSYDYQYRPFTCEMIDNALALQDDWCAWKDCEATEVLAAENRAIQRTFLAWRHFPQLLGGALVIDDIVGAYTIAEHLDDETVVIHYEKGCPAYKGVYQAVNQMFLESLGEAYTFVNREQDLGDEGLRQAKLSYHPVGFNEKYRVRLTA
jgi:hypothetical protein